MLSSEFGGIVLADLRVAPAHCGRNRVALDRDPDAAFGVFPLERWLAETVS